MRNDGALPAFDPELFACARAELGVTWGRPLRHFAETSSTNDRALDECDSAMKTGGVFVAESQTGGRGRRGNAWYSASGENLTFSVLLRLPIPPEKTATLALIVGLALRAAITLTLVAGKRPETARVKWPNDVLVEGRKLAGILVETRVRGAETTAIVGVVSTSSNGNFLRPPAVRPPSRFLRSPPNIEEESDCSLSSSANSSRASAPGSPEVSRQASTSFDGTMRSSDAASSSTKNEGRPAV